MVRFIGMQENPEVMVQEAGTCSVGEQSSGQLSRVSPRLQTLFPHWQSSES